MQSPSELLAPVNLVTEIVCDADRRTKSHATAKLSNAVTIHDLIEAEERIQKLSNLIDLNHTYGKFAII